jgi:hypothetical protein
VAVSLPCGVDHRLADVEAAVRQMPAVRVEVVEERAVATAEIGDRAFAILVDRLQQIPEPQGLRLRRAPVDAARRGAEEPQLLRIVVSDGL